MLGLLAALALAVGVAVWAHHRGQPEHAPSEPDAPPLHPLLRAGPMVGWVEEDRAMLWVQTIGAAKVDITLGRATKLSAQTSTDNDCIARFEFAGLAPGRHAYTVDLNHERVALPYEAEFTVPAPGAADFTFTLGSCLWVNDPTGGPGGDYELLDALAAENADFMLWLGDNVYLRDNDWDSETAMRARYSHTRAFGRLRPLLATRANFAIWDDHDYGPNDSGADFILKQAALKVMRDYWPGPQHTARGRLAWGDCEFFLLDDRAFRQPGKEVLGADQLQWLLDGLAASKATFKFVACGTQVLNPLNQKEPFPPAELEAITGAIVRRRIAGVVFVSGDRHFAELIRVQPAGCYPLLDFTTSPLASPNNPPPQGSAESDNPSRVAGTLVADKRNYGRVRVTGAAGARALELSCHDKSGAVLWTHRVSQRELTFTD